MRIRAFPTYLWLITTIFLTVACEPNHKSTDEAQLQAREANMRLERMNDIELKLRAQGLSIHYPSYSKETLAALPDDSSLKSMKTLLSEYIEHGQKALGIATRDDISFGNKHNLEENVVNANLVLSLVQEKAAAPATNAALSPSQAAVRFGLKWKDCRESQTRDLTLHGIGVTTYESATDRARLTSLNTEQRQDVYKRARTFLFCERTLHMGDDILYPGAANGEFVESSHTRALLQDLEVSASP